MGCLWVSDCSALSLVFVQGTDTERGFTKLIQRYTKLIQSYTKHKGIQRYIKLIQGEFHKSDTKVHKTTSNLTQLIVGKQIVSQRSLTEAFFVPDLFFTRSIFFLPDLYRTQSPTYNAKYMNECSKRGQLGCLANLQTALWWSKLMFADLLFPKFQINIWYS